MTRLERLDDPIERRLRDMSVHLVGFTSLEIADVACFLGERGVRQLRGHDLCEPDALREHFRAAHIGMDKSARQAHWDRLTAFEIPLCLGDDYLAGIDDADVVIVSQAWRLYARNEPLETLRQGGAVRFLTPVEIYLEIAANKGIRTVGITGSNGKSTTTNMVATVLTTAQRPFVLAGNYRYRGPILESLNQLDASGTLVLELSNHHLLAVQRGVDVAVVTNVTPNHLEEHGGLEGYIASKRRIAETQSASGVLILNADDPISRDFSGSTRGDVKRFSVARTDVDASSIDGRLSVRTAPEVQGLADELVATKDLAVFGLHNVQNALAAALVTCELGLSVSEISQGLQSFTGAPGRLEHTRTVGEVRFIWDIESTTPESTIKGLEAFNPGAVHLIAGGDNKGLDYAHLVNVVAERHVKLVLLDGSATALIRAACEASGVAYVLAESLDEAVRECFESSRPGDVVLVSPGAKGFYNLHVRGKASFKRLVKRLRASQRGAGLVAEEGCSEPVVEGDK